GPLGRLPVGHGYPHHEVGPAPLEDLVGRHVHVDEQVAGRAAPETGATLALHTDALTVVDARGDPDLDLPGAGLDARAAAGRARVVDGDARAPAPGTGLREPEGSLVDRDGAHAPALRAAGGRGARARAVAP